MEGPGTGREPRGRGKAASASRRLGVNTHVDLTLHHKTASGKHNFTFFSKLSEVVCALLRPGGLL